MALNFIKESITIGADKITDKTFTFFKQGFRLSSAIGEPEYRDVTVSGVDVLNLPNAKADGLNYCKLYGKCEQSDLPEGYTEVEYLESTGTQYINTGIVLDSTMTVRIKYDYVAQGFVFGSRASTSSYYSGITHESGGSYRIRYGNKVLYNRSSVPTDTVDVVISPDGVTLNGVVVSTTSYGTNFYNGNCYLFTINNNGEAFVGEYAVNRIRRFAIDNIINLIPCRRNSDSVLGMYDTVTNTFLTNAGTGTFTAGNDVVPTPTRPLNIICNNGVVKVSPNLFDKNSQYIAGFVNSDTGVLSASTEQAQQRSFVIPCLPNTTYVLQGMTANSTWGSFTSSTIGTRATSYVTGNTTLTTGSNDKYLIGLAYTASGLDYRNTLQIEASSTATAYRPYGQIYVDGTTETVKDSLNNTATAQNLLSIGTYKDVQEVLTGAVTKNIDVITLAGNESGLDYYGVYSGHNLFYYEISATQAFKAETNAPLCTHYISYSGDPTTMPNNCARYQIGNSMTNYNRIYFTDDRFSTLSDWKAFIAQQYTNGTPIIIATIRPTPTTSTVTAQTLTTKKGTNTIEITQASLTDLPIEVNYMAGVSVTVQQIEDSNLDNQVTVTIGE